MQKDSEKRRGSIIAAAVVIIFLSLFIGLFLFLTISARNWIVTFMFTLYIIIEAAVIIGVIIALRQRLNEIKKGEEKDADKY